MKYAELARTRANSYGATIGKLDGWAGVQTHDIDKMVRAGKDAGSGMSRRSWIFERTFSDAPTATDAARILGDIYDTRSPARPRSETMRRCRRTAIARRRT